MIYPKMSQLIFATFCTIGSAYAAEESIGSLPSQQTNIDTAQEAGCPTHIQLSGKMTPVELYKALTACINKADYDSAVTVFGLAGTYGRFDTMRVTDVSAHQAVKVLKQLAFESSNADQRTTFQKKAGALFDDISSRQALCEQIKRIGPPAYYPRYMVQHGLGVINGTNQTNDGLVHPFDAKAAWDQSITSYLSCK